MLYPESHERYVNFYTDFAFKKLFGTEVNKALLISFLNSMLNGQEEIEDLTYLNTEQLGEYEKERKAIFDVYCKTSAGEYILVEMQKADQQYFKDRSVFYSTFPIRDQVKKGGRDYCLKKVYTIGVLNFCFDDKDPEYYHHEVKLIDTKTKEVFYDKLTYIYLEMPKFKKTEDELETLFDKWLYAISHLDTLMERPKVLQDAVFAHLFEQAEIAKYNPQERQSYEASLKIFRDMYSVMTTKYVRGHEEGHKKGLAEGIEIGKAQGIEIGKAEGLAQGLAQGEEKRNIEIIRRQRAKGKTAEDIADLLDLPLEYVEKLCDEQRK